MKTNNLPLDLQHPGGFVEDVMNYINDTAVCPQPVFALGAALTLAGLLYGRRVKTDDGQRTNIFAMAVGYTSSGKDHALKAIARILDSCEASHMRLGQVTSDSAIEWALKRQPRLGLLIDEAGHFFNGVTDAKAKGTAQHAIKPALLELWSSANARWVGKQRVPKDGKSEQPPTVVDCPHLCLYGTTQPQILFEGLTRNDLRDGGLARNLFFISTTRPKPRFRPEAPVPNAIRAVTMAYRDGGPLVTVPDGDGTREVFAAFGDDIYRRMLTADKSGDEANYLYGKAVENARRVALVLAVSRAGEEPLRARIDPCDAEYATALVGYLISTMIAEVRASLSENADEKAKKRILQIVAAAGAKGVTRNELTRKTQFIRRTMRDEYLQDLIDAEEVVVKEFSDGRKHGERILLNANI